MKDKLKTLLEGIKLVHQQKRTSMEELIYYKDQTLTEITRSNLAHSIADYLLREGLIKIECVENGDERTYTASLWCIPENVMNEFKDHRKDE